MSIKSFFTISIYTKCSDGSNDNNFQFHNNDKIINNHQPIIKNEQSPTNAINTTSNSTSIIIKSGEYFKKKGTLQDDYFQIEFIDPEIPIPIQMNNTFLVFISCALLVLAFFKVALVDFYKDAQGRTINKQDQEEYVKYYSNLYDYKDDDPPSHYEMLENWTVTRDSTWDNLQNEFTPQEILEVIKQLNPHKSPGPDGIPNLFYITHKEKLAPILASAFNDTLRNPHLITNKQ
ncbi:hypothetical protein ACTFIU_006682 [Dictyostelium citrinum]